MHITVPQPTSNYWPYRQAVQRAIQQTPDQWTFKSDPGYREVLEHVTPVQGSMLLKWAKRAEPDISRQWLQRLAERNDSIGGPFLVDYLDGMYSPSNWRYLCHAIKLWRHIESLNLPEVDVIELGGGYGGLALWVRGIAEMFRARVGDYWIVDLPEAAELQRQVAEVLNVDIMTVSGFSSTMAAFMDLDIPTPRVLMSAYAFSEFDQDTRDWYADRLIRHCDHGMMIWNFPEPAMLDDGQWYGGPVYPFTDKPLTVVPDEPALYAGHQVVTW